MATGGRGSRKGRGEKKRKKKKNVGSREK